MTPSAETKALSGQVIRRLHGIQHVFSYTSCFCEENVHLLASTLVRLGQAPSIDNLFVVFISNPSKQVPLWKQRAGLPGTRRRRRRRSQPSRSTDREARRQHSGRGGNASGRGDGRGGGGAPASAVASGSGEDESDQEEEEKKEEEEEAGGGSSAGIDSSGGEGSSDGGEDGDGDDSDGDEGLVVWDYHVVLLQTRTAAEGPQQQGRAAAEGPQQQGRAAAEGPQQQGRAAVEVAAELSQAEVGAAATVAMAAGAAGAAAAPDGPAAEAGPTEATVEAGGRQQQASESASRVLGAASGGGGGGSAAASAATAGASGGATLVWDLDTLLPFPCSLELYSRRALKSHLQLAERHRRFFRVVPAASYLRFFASDRSHMRLPGGGWSAQPPSYPPLAAVDGTTNNIQRYWDMTTRDLEAAAEAGQRGPPPPCSSAAVTSPLLTRALASAGPYGVVLDDQSFLHAFASWAG